MGTRGLIGVVIDGQMKGSYNHYDSYPVGGLGEEVVEFVKELNSDPAKLKTFNENIRKVEWVDESELLTPEQLKKHTESGFPLESETLQAIQAIGMNRGTPITWYWMLRDYQGIGYFEGVMQGLAFLLESTNFIKDSLFCEYAYILDLDENCVDFYQGLHRIYGNVTQYADYEVYKDVEGVRYVYGECKKVGSVPFSQIDTVDLWEIYKEED